MTTPKKMKQQVLRQVLQCWPLTATACLVMTCDIEDPLFVAAANA